jgi:flagellar hook assembly protein FlgD
VSLADVTAVEALDHPTTVRLAVMPNPARGAVGISWGVPRAGTGTVAVYDILGRRVALLLKGPMEAGAHNLTWAGMDDASQTLSAGLYFVRFTGEAGTATARVILLGGR